MIIMTNENEDEPSSPRRTSKGGRSDDDAPKVDPPQPYELALVRAIESKSSSLLDTFLRLDEDKDGYVTRSDLKTALHNDWGVDLTPTQMDAIFARFAFYETDHRDAIASKGAAGEDGAEREGAGGEEEEEEVDAAAGLDGAPSSRKKKKTHLVRHGIRYSEFVRYIQDTASSTTGLPSSTVYGSTLALSTDEEDDDDGGDDAAASATTPSATKQTGKTTNKSSPPPPRKMSPIKPSPNAARSELRRTLGRLLSSHTSSSPSRPKDATLFLAMDIHRTGKVTPDEFKHWIENNGLVLTDEQVQTVLGSHFKEEGINLKEFVKVIESIEDDDGDADEDAAWQPDADDAMRRLAAVTAADALDEAREKLLDAATKQCLDDVKTDRELIYAIETKLFRKKTTLIEAFRKYATSSSSSSQQQNDGTDNGGHGMTTGGGGGGGGGKIGPVELVAALREADLHVSESRAESLVKKFDRDGDGRLNTGDFVRLVQSAGVPFDDHIAAAQGRGAAVLPTGENSSGGGDDDEEAADNDDETEEAMRRSLVSSVLGHEDEQLHREVASRLDADDIAAILQFREALEVEHLMARRTFERMDTTKCRSLSPEELKVGFERLGLDISQEHINHIIRRFDTDGTGRLKYYQFIKLLSANLDD